MAISVVAHCDWSITPKKRWMAVAIRRGGLWNIRPPEPVGDTSNLFERLQRLAAEPGVLLSGFDFPIGLPEAYARAAEFKSFRAALELLGTGPWSNWFTVAENRNEISLHRPFYPARPGGTARSHLFGALGIAEPNDLLRLCERATSDRQAACMLFWTLGGNQVGKGAISGWKEVIVPRLSEIGLWPFDGTLSQLEQTKQVIVAETYPGDVYRQLGIPRSGWSKRRQADRARMGETILSWLAERSNLEAEASQDLIRDGFGLDSAGEDRFDAMVGLLGMFEVVTGKRSEGVPALPSVHTWEGWILGHYRQGLS